MKCPECGLTDMHLLRCDMGRVERYGLTETALAVKKAYEIVDYLAKLSARGA